MLISILHYILHTQNDLHGRVHVDQLGRFFDVYDIVNSSRYNRLSELLHINICYNNQLSS